MQLFQTTIHIIIFVIRVYIFIVFCLLMLLLTPDKEDYIWRDV